MLFHVRSKKSGFELYKKKIMKIIDLTHFIAESMPVYPGSRRPSISDANTIVKDGYAEKMISMSSHTGTHIDAPAHMIDKGTSLDMMDFSRFAGMAYVIDVSSLKKKEIGEADVSLKAMSEADFILFYTGWSQFWGKDQYFKDYPVLSAELATKISQLNLKGIGLDVISIDPVGAKDFVNHMIIFRSDMLIIENLTNLDLLREKEFMFVCNPLKLKDADGSPVRAFGYYDD